MTNSNEIWFRFMLFFYASIPSLLKSGVSGFESTFFHHRLILLQWLRQRVNAYPSSSLPEIPAAIICMLVSSVAIVDVGVSLHPGDSALIND
jgi:hypothetical protein